MEKLKHRPKAVDESFRGVGERKQRDYSTVARSRDEYVSLAEAAIFEYAFRLGAKLTMEIHKDEE